MKGIEHHSEELLLAEKGSTKAQRKASTRNRKFTFIGLTSFTGESSEILKNSFIGFRNSRFG